MLEKMLQDLEHIQEETKSQLKKVVSQEELNEIRVKFLGKKGELTAILKGMGKLNNEDRPKVGQVANEIRNNMEGFIAERSSFDCSDRRRAN